MRVPPPSALDRGPAGGKNFGSLVLFSCIYVQYSPSLGQRCAWSGEVAALLRRDLSVPAGGPPRKRDQGAVHRGGKRPPRRAWFPSLAWPPDATGAGAGLRPPWPGAPAIPNQGLRPWWTARSTALCVRAAPLFGVRSPSIKGGGSFWCSEGFAQAGSAGLPAVLNSRRASLHAPGGA